MGEQAKILIVEDEGIVALDLKNRSRRLGYTVVAVVASGEEAILKTAETQPDLILLDIRLRGEMDGIQTAQAIRDRCDVPVIYLTAMADKDTLQRAEASQPSGLIMKPFADDELRTTIEAALGQRRTSNKNRI
jgi:CheY-like chemotaxis protein